MEQIKELPPEFSLSYEYFKKHLLDKTQRPQVTFNGHSYFIYISEDTTTFGIEEAYLHLISIEGDKFKKEKYPCKKGTPLDNCRVRCKMQHADNIFNFVTERRVQCINRAKQLHNIIKTIELNNNDSPLVTSWKEKSCICLRYQNFTKYIDYIVVFKYIENDHHKNPYLELITAYPVFEKFTKDKFDNKYHKYIKKA